MSKTLYVCNDTGIMLTGDVGDRVTSIRIIEGAVGVEMWIETTDSTDYLQYLSAVEAMALGLTLQRLASVALRNEAEAVTGHGV